MKAGARTPATLSAPPAVVAGRLRSTKAGARTPATRPSLRWTRLRCVSAQRRPGREPRRHGPCGPIRARREGSLNEGRGANPGDTGANQDARANRRTAQRRPGREPRRHSERWASRMAFWVAQRRPGREPRRHEMSAERAPVGPHRSTKAGARTPATRGGRRPVLRPVGRSTKAGARTPATRGHQRPLVGDHDRSTKAGARTPATRQPHPVR